MPRQATDEADSYDYIVVGSGAGGGPVAANLARAGMRVLVLEAGGAAEGLSYQVPAFHGLASEDPALRWDYFVRHYASDALQVRDPKFTPARNGVLYPRAGTLGGCTAHNAMITVYPHNHDFDAIAAATGDRSWRSTRMRRYFQRLERCQYLPRPWAASKQPLVAWLGRVIQSVAPGLGNPTRHGFTGWLSTTLASPDLALRDRQLLRIILSAAEDTLADSLGRPLTPWEGLNALVDPNDWRVQGGRMEGLWLTPLATAAGQRNGTREYLRQVEAAHPRQLSIQTDSLATRVLLDPTNRAIGVEYLRGAHLYRADPRSQGQSMGDPRRAYARREVILACGAFNSPQLLKLSGIGPAQELRQHAIDVRVDLRGVGENLQDRYEVGVISELADTFDLIRDCAFCVPTPGAPADPCLDEWQAGRGPYTSNGVAVSIIRRSRPELPEPDLFIFGLPIYFRGYLPGYSADLFAQRNAFTWAVLKAHTRNTAGRVTLRSSDPRETPEITFHYFEEGNDALGADLDAVVDGVEFARQLNARLGAALKREVVPGPDVQTRADLAQFVRDQAWGHHACGTCKIGPASDPLAVVDHAFRVRGTRNLRVVDASVFPHIPGFFIVSAVYMVAEKASDVLLSDARRSAPA